MPSIAAVLYLRVSTDKQETSIEQQRAELQAYAAKHGYTIVREYVDEAISGDDTERRMSFKQMLQDVTRGDFKVVLCWDQDRFGRFDPLEAGYWIKPLRDHGVRLETIAQGKIDWEDFAGRIVYAVQQEAKHAYLRDLSRNVARGMMAAMREGKWQGGRPPFGYQVVDQRLVPADPDKVEVVRRIYREYAYTETSVRALTFKLTAEGVPAPEGTRWSPPVVHKILKSPIYIGHLVWNRRRQGKYFGVEGGAITAMNRDSTRGKTPKADWLVKPGNHEAIIGRDLWELVQQRLHERRLQTSPTRGGGPFLLSGLVVCARCGKKMYCSLERQHGIEHFYLRCASYSSFGLAACENFKINERPLADLIIRKVTDGAKGPRGRAALRQELTRKLQERQGGNPAQVRALECSVASLNRKIEEGTTRYLTAPRNLMAGIEALLAEWTAERDTAKRQLAALEAVKKENLDIDAKVEQCMDRLKQLPKALSSADPAKVRGAIKEAVTHITCWFEKAPYGSKKRTVLDRGTIHLRPDYEFIGLVAHGGPSNTPTGDTR